MRSEDEGARWVGRMLAILFVVVVVTIFVILSAGCSSSKPLESEDREIEYAPFHVPVPSPELEGISWAELLGQLHTPTLSRQAVEDDGSVLIQALTHDFLIVLDELWKAFTQRDASNAARQVVIDAQAEAEAELERLRSQ